MKKIYSLILFLTIICTGSAIGMETDRFVENFMTCTPYTERNSSQMFGMQVDSALEVLGFRGGLCGFRSTINTPSGSAKIECNFTEEQIMELISAMENNRSEIETFAQQGLDSNPNIDSNPAVVIFNKYFTDSSVCSVTN